MANIAASLRRVRAGEDFPQTRKSDFSWSMDLRQTSPSTARNREPILTVLQGVLLEDAHVLEVASGTGEHAVFFAGVMPSVTWQPSDPDADARASIEAWREAAVLPNVLTPLDIDLASADWRTPRDQYDAIVAINVIHISPWEATLGLMAGAARLLAPNGQLITYGAYKYQGEHTAPSNESFDQWLKARDPRFGVRDVEAVTAAAREQGFARHQVVTMPANNFMLLFRR
jgi:cyclopropane fatty-acyl-phospholipid synthase-like methyltransferase